jgi:putative CocE/NonD family hydrolase
MNLMSHILQRQLELPPPLTRALVVERDLRVPMPDGVELLADRWAPRSGGKGLPTALLRSPYGRAGVFGTAMARPLAERGYQVLIQSVRGGFGSGGTLDPMRQEREDGLATLDWVSEQPWFGDSMVLVGMSYLGFVQWAVADRLPPQVKAMIPQVTESALTLEFMRADGRSLELPFEWGVMVAKQERRGAMLRTRSQAKKTVRAMYTLPLGQADALAIGRPSAYIQDVLEHDANDEYWADLDHSHRVPDVTVPVSSIGGWYDIFLPGQLRDFQALRESGNPARLTIGPWTHSEFNNVSTLEALEFGLAYARGEAPPAGLRILAAAGLHTQGVPPPG